MQAQAGVRSHAHRLPRLNMRDGRRQTLFRACVCSGCDSTNFGWIRSGVTFSSGCSAEQSTHSFGLHLSHDTALDEG